MISELTPPQRWQWVGLLLLAGESSEPGIIFKRRDQTGTFIGYADITLADLLDLDIDVFRDGIQRMINADKIRVGAQGEIYITNWSKYQSEYLRQKPHRKACNLSYKKGYKKGYKGGYKKSYDVDIEGEGDIDVEEKKKEENTTTAAVRNNLNNKKTEEEAKKEPKITITADAGWQGITPERLALWRKAYPACDIEIELARAAAWVLENPAKGKKSNYGRFLTNWLSRTQDKGGTRRATALVTSPDYDPAAGEAEYLAWKAERELARKKK